MFRSTFYYIKSINTQNTLIHFRKYNFSTNIPATTGAQGQVANAPIKTKEQLKVEALMQQWPEALRNPKGYLDNEIAKGIYEDLYKYHQGDKKYLGSYDIPLDYSRDFLAVVNQCFTTETISDFFKSYEGFLPEHMIMSKFQEIGLRYRDTTPELFQDILPQVKKVLVNADRLTARNLHFACVGGSYLNLNDNEFWEILVIIFHYNI
jgi:hypothetical protein